MCYYFVVNKIPCIHKQVTLQRAHTITVSIRHCNVTRATHTVCLTGQLFLLLMLLNHGFHRLWGLTILVDPNMSPTIKKLTSRQRHKSAVKSHTSLP